MAKTAPNPAQQQRAQALAFLSTDTVTIATRLVDSNPWLCQQLGVQLTAWSRPFLEEQGLAAAAIHMVGSAATGFSLNPGRLGQPFRLIAGRDQPSDLDLAVIDEALFARCWNEMVFVERRGGLYLAPQDRERVYWGRIDDRRIPERTESRLTLRRLNDAVRRSAEFRGYPASIRVYRRREDLVYYLVHGFRMLLREITP